jgi:hypothetical protein
MTTIATHNGHATTPERGLFMAFELSEKTRKLGFTTGHGQKPRERLMSGHILSWSVPAQVGDLCETVGAMTIASLPTRLPAYSKELLPWAPGPPRTAVSLHPMAIDQVKAMAIGHRQQILGGIALRHHGRMHHATYHCSQLKNLSGVSACRFIVYHTALSLTV